MFINLRISHEEILSVIGKFCFQYISDSWTKYKILIFLNHPTFYPNLIA